MPLNGTSADALGTAIFNALGGTGTVGEPQWQTICRQIYAHLVTDTVVNVASVSGVTPGGGVSGPGTGTVS